MVNYYLTPGAIIDSSHTWDETQTFGDITLDGDLDFVGPQEISTSSGALTLAPALAVTIADGTGLIVGHTATVGVNNQNYEFEVLGTEHTDTALTIGRWSNDYSGPLLNFVKSRGATIGSHVDGIVEDDDWLGMINAFIDDGVDYRNTAASIGFYVDGTPGSNDAPGRIVFWTTADDAASPTERWRIDNVGNLTSAGAVSNVTADGSVLATGGFACTDVLNAWIDDAQHGDDTVTHYIGQDSIDVTDLSDARQKENLVPFTGAIMDSIQQLDFINYNRVGKTEKRFGLTAQEMQKYFPEYVWIRSDDYLQIAYHKMMPIALRGLQEHEARFSTVNERIEVAMNAIQYLRAEVAALKES